MNKKQIEKELQKQAILFEDKCMKGQVTAAMISGSFRISGRYCITISTTGSV